MMHYCHITDTCHCVFQDIKCMHMINRSVIYTEIVMITEYRYDKFDMHTDDFSLRTSFQNILCMMTAEYEPM